MRRLCLRSSSQTICGIDSYLGFYLPGPVEVEGGGKMADAEDIIVYNNQDEI